MPAKFMIKLKTWIDLQSFKIKKKPAFCACQRRTIFANSAQFHSVVGNTIKLIEIKKGPIVTHSGFYRGQRLVDIDNNHLIHHLARMLITGGTLCSCHQGPETTWNRLGRFSRDFRAESQHWPCLYGMPASSRSRCVYKPLWHLQVETALIYLAGGPYLCPKCSLPLCGSKCQDGPNHRPECQVFSQTLPSGFQFRVDCSREPLVTFARGKTFCISTILFQNARPNQSNQSRICLHSTTKGIAAETKPTGNVEQNVTTDGLRGRPWYGRGLQTNDTGKFFIVTCVYLFLTYWEFFSGQRGKLSEECLSIEVYRKGNPESLRDFKDKRFNGRRSLHESKFIK